MENIERQIEIHKANPKKLLMIGDVHDDLNTWTKIFETGSLSAEQMMIIGKDSKDFFIWKAIVKTGVLTEKQLQGLGKEFCLYEILEDIQDEK